MIIVGKIISFEYKHALLCGQDNKGAGGGRGQQKQEEADGARKRNRERANKRPFFSGRADWGTEGMGRECVTSFILSETR